MPLLENETWSTEKRAYSALCYHVAYSISNQMHDTFQQVVMYAKPCEKRIFVEHGVLVDEYFVKKVS